MHEFKVIPPIRRCNDWGRRRRAQHPSAGAPPPDSESYFQIEPLCLLAVDPYALLAQQYLRPAMAEQAAPLAN